MGLKEEMDGRLKAAMKAKDERVLDVVRMIRARAQTEASGKGRELDDGLYEETIRTYVKQMRRALVDYEKAGDDGAEMADKLRFEVSYLEPLLPRMMSEEEARPLVEAAIAAHGITDPKQAGRVVGLVMKDHRGEVEPALIKRIAEALLG